MLKFIFIIIFIIAILFILMNKSKDKKNTIKFNIYKKLIFTVIVLAILFVVVTSGKLILPQLMQIVKIGIPLISKLIGL